MISNLLLKIEQREGINETKNLNMEDVDSCKIELET